ncbi:hypothetical protein BH09PAT2_BH09PAT2_01860 [soil metagenome]
MRLVKVISLSVVLALIVYFVFSRIMSSRKTILSPLPEEGIKIIELSPTK